MHPVFNRAIQEIESLDKTSPTYASLLETALTRVDKNGDSAFYTAANSGNVEVIEKILDHAKLYPKILEKILDQESHYGDKPLRASIDHGRKDIFKLIIDSTKDHQSLNKKLTKEVHEFFLNILLNQDDAFVGKVMAAVKGTPELRRELLTTTFGENLSPLYDSSMSQNRKVTKEILLGIEDDRELMRELLDYKPPLKWSFESLENYVWSLGTTKIMPDEGIIPIINNLVIRGDEENLGIILRNFPNKKFENIPNAYLSISEQESIFFTQGINKIFGESCELSFYQDGDKKSINALENPGSPIIVENGHGEKAILSQNIDFSEKHPRDNYIKNLKLAMGLADNEKIDRIIFGFNARQHAVTAVMTRGIEKWEIEVHDSNTNNRYSGHLKPMFDATKDLNITRIKNADPIIKNSNSNAIPNGHCSIVSKIVAAAALIYREEDLKKFCTDEGRGCSEKLLDNLLPHLNEVFQQRFFHLRENLMAANPETYLPKYSSMITYTNELPCYNKNGVNYPPVESTNQPQDALIAQCQKSEQKITENSLANTAVKGLTLGVSSGLAEAFFQKVLGMEASDANLAASGLMLAYLANQAGMVVNGDFSAITNDPVTSLVAGDLGLRLIGSFTDKSSTIYKTMSALSYLPTLLCATTSLEKPLEVASSCLTFLAGNFIGKKMVEIPLTQVSNTYAQAFSEQRGQEL